MLKMKGKPLDLTGQRFGRLLAVERAGVNEHKQTLWRCECDCGNKEFIVLTQSLVKRATQSCGCIKNEAKYSPLANKRFGRLVVLKIDGKSANGQTRWMCQCDCGNTVTVARSSLLKGDTRSCGCIARERNEKRKNSIAGQRFGRLVAVERVSTNKYGKTLWRCECDCGNINYITSQNHLSMGAKSCGCQQREKASEIGKQNIKKAMIVSNAAFVNNTYALLLASDKLPKHNKSGVKGVCWDKRCQKWEAYIYFQKKSYRLGHYGDIAEAAKVRKAAEERIHGPFLDWYEENIMPLLKRRSNNKMK